MFFKLCPVTKEVVPRTMTEPPGDNRLFRTPVSLTCSIGIKPFIVSTIFLSVEHGAGLFFETMVFQAEQNTPSSSWYGCEIYCQRYATYHEAATGHARVCFLLAHNQLDIKDPFKFYTISEEHCSELSDPYHGFSHIINMKYLGVEDNLVPYRTNFGEFNKATFVKSASQACIDYDEDDLPEKFPEASVSHYLAHLAARWRELFPCEYERQHIHAFVRGVI